MKRFAATFLLPAALLFALVAGPLATGSRTLVLRDTLLTHLAMREGLAQALRAGELPVVDPLRAGGQALAGNLNAVALYPDNLLLFVSSTLWQLNAHFWLHWALAFVAAFALARASGGGREAAAVAGAAYAFGGFFLSQLNLYNAVAPAALAPALAAAAIALRRGDRPRRAFVALALVWALSLLGGDPVLAGLALVAAMTLAAGARPSAEGRAASNALVRTGLALAIGTALAAPQLLATSALLGESSRGFRGFSVRDLVVASPGPRALLDLFVPLFFGRPDSGSFWGTAFFGGTPPLYFSLAPGVVALAFAVAGLGGGRVGRRGDDEAGIPARGAPLALVVAGAILAFGSGTWISSALAALPGASLLRFQGKFALPFALGLALLAARGAERVLAGSRRAFVLALGGLAAAELAFVAFLAARPAALYSAFVERFAHGLRGAALDAEAKRWAGVALLAAAAALLGGLAALVRRRAGERRGATAVAVGIAIQVASQLLLLRGLLPTAEATTFRSPPPAIAALPEDSRSVHGAGNQLFGAALLDAPGADPRLAAQVERAWASGFGFAAHAAGRRTELDLSPEGLDPFAVAAAADAVKSLPDVDRIRLLRATGVTHLLLPRALDGVPEALARLERVDEALEPPLRTYALDGGWGEATVATCVVRAPHMNGALASLRDPAFDPATHAVVPGNGAPSCPEVASAPPSRARVVVSRPDAVDVEVEAPAGGVLVLARAVSPVWRVTVDGRRAKPVPAQMSRLAVELPPGARRVSFRADRRPLVRGVVVALAAALALGLSAGRLRAGGRSDGDIAPEDSAATAPGAGSIAPS